MRYRILMVAFSLALFGSVVAVTDASAQSASACDGLSGNRHGLCQAAEALGCSPESTSRACQRIAETYIRQIGETPPWLAPAYPVQTATMHYYASIDLEGGSICTDYLGACSSAPAPNDFWFAFNSLREQPTVLLQRQYCNVDEPLATAEIAYFSGSAFDDITPAILALLPPDSFTTGYVDSPLDSANTVILHTCSDNYFKIGAATCKAGAPGDYPGCTDDTLPDNSVKFSYQRLQ